jgi:hypothetical protein
VFVDQSSAMEVLEELRDSVSALNEFVMNAPTASARPSLLTMESILQILPQDLLHGNGNLDPHEFGDKKTKSRLVFLAATRMLARQCLTKALSSVQISDRTGYDVAVSEVATAFGEALEECGYGQFNTEFLRDELKAAVQRIKARNRLKLNQSARAETEEEQEYDEDEVIDEEQDFYDEDED